MKRWFISSYLALLAALVVVGLYGLTRPVPPGAPGGMLLAALAPLGFFVWLFAARPPRTAAHPVLVSVLSGLGAVIAMSTIYRFGEQHQPWLVGAVFSLAGWLAYTAWYSRLRTPVNTPVLGEQLPEFEVIGPDGKTVSSRDLRGHNAVLLFYRGNWCPLCMAQIRELAAAWRRVARHNAKVWFISSQSQKHTRAIASRFSIPAQFLRDPDNRAATALGVEVRGAAPAGTGLLGFPADAALPTVIVVDEQGVIRFIEVARNYRLRPDPDTYLKYLVPKEPASIKADKA